MESYIYVKQVGSECKMRSNIQNITLSFTTVLTEGVLYLFILHQLFESGGRRKMNVWRICFSHDTKEDTDELVPYSNFRQI